MQRLWDLVHALDVRSKRMAKDLGITGPQRLVIRVVGQSPGCTANYLSSILGLHPSTMTGILTRLEAQQMLRREVDPEDRRRARFHLTSRGLEIDRARRGTVEAAVRRVLQRADPEVEAHTLEMLAMLVQELERDD